MAVAPDSLRKNATSFAMVLKPLRSFRKDSIAEQYFTDVYGTGKIERFATPRGASNTP
jgi:hypothetical protein